MWGDREGGKEREKKKRIIKIKKVMRHISDGSL